MSWTPGVPVRAHGGSAHRLISGPQSARVEQALRHHQQGDLARAGALYAEVLRAEPRHRDALHLLGVLQVQSRQVESGIELIRQSLQVDPQQAGAQMNLGNALRDLSRPAEALASFEAALRLSPRFAEAFYNRGNALADLGRLEEACSSYEHALQIEPHLSAALYQLGNTLMRLDRPEAALAAYTRLLQLEPDHPGALHNQGNALVSLQRPADALASYDRALRFDSRSAETWNNRGSTLRALGRPVEALESFEHALALDPQFAEALNNVGNSLREQHRYLEATDCYERAARLKPGLPDPHINWSIALRELRRPQEALERIDQALRLAPASIEALNDRGNVLVDLKRGEEALASYAAALRLEPTHLDTVRNRAAALQRLRRYGEAAECFRQLLALAPDHDYALGSALDCELKCCDWRRYDESVSRLLAQIDAGRRSAMPFGLLSVSSGAAAQMRCARAHADGVSAAQVGTSLCRRTGYRHAKIRVAYISADLREHVVGYLMAGVFEQHDRERFEVIAISLSPPDGTEIGRRVKAAFDRFIDVSGRSDADVAAFIGELQVDIAVDLSGHTEGNRVPILAAHPAPVQVNYLGYPGTMGAPFMDYIIADPFVVPSSLRECYAEQIVYLPECFQGNDDRRPVGPVLTRGEAGLPESAFVWCCFNASYKLNPRMLDIWCRLLAGVPGSVLWLLGHEEVVREHLRSEAYDRGVDPARLVFGERLPYAQHLGRLAVADLFLDTLPFNAGATASDALWAGVPVLTCAGEAFAARMAGSLLHAIGLPELVTDNLVDYERRALELAHEPRRLRELKDRLLANRSRSPLFDTRRFCRHLEAAYEQMWRRAENGEPPMTFRVRELERGEVVP